jgi:hypothetical protein
VLPGLSSPIVRGDEPFCRAKDTIIVLNLMIAISSPLVAASKLNTPKKIKEVHLFNQ